MEDKLEMLEGAIDALCDAIVAVGALGKNYERDVVCLEEICNNYQAEADKIHTEMEIADAIEQRALEREYYRAVI